MATASWAVWGHDREFQVVTKCRNCQKKKKKKLASAGRESRQDVPGRDRVSAVPMLRQENPMSRHGFQLGLHDNAKRTTEVFVRQQRAHDRVWPGRELLCCDRGISCRDRVGPSCVSTENYLLRQDLVMGEKGSHVAT